MKRPTFRDVKLFLWNAGAAFCIIMACIHNIRHDTAQSTWYNVMTFGLLMLARTEKHHER